jgi:hypothetical protein
MTRPVLFSVMDAHGAARILELKGRDAWALSELVRAGKLGCGREHRRAGPAGQVTSTNSGTDTASTS